MANAKPRAPDDYLYRDLEVVWARIEGFPWWPGQCDFTLLERDHGKDKTSRIPIRWFGDDHDRVDWLTRDRIIPFSLDIEAALHSEMAVEEEDVPEYQATIEDAVLRQKKWKKKIEKKQRKDIKARLLTMGFSSKDIRRAFKVDKKKYGQSYNLEVLTDILVNLQNKEKVKQKGKKEERKNDRTEMESDNVSDQRQHAKSDIVPYRSHMTMQEAHQLKVGDKIDYRDHTGRYVNGTVSEKQKTNLKIECHGWSRKWDIWSDFKKELFRFAFAGSITKRPAHRFSSLEEGDCLDINPVMGRAGWKSCVIQQFDQHSGQVQVQYRMNDKKYLIWAHLDNEVEIAAHQTRSGSECDVVSNLRTEMNADQSTASNLVPVAPHHRDSVHTISNSDQKRQQTEDASSFPSHMTLQDANKLKIGDKIDHRDVAGQSVFATVSEKQGTNLKIHYDGWPKKWDIWSDFSKEIHRFAVAGSISMRPAHRFLHLKVADFVDINPVQQHAGWKAGVIKRVLPKSGQVQVAYSMRDKNHLYWTHLDNASEITQFRSNSEATDMTELNAMKARFLEKYRRKQREMAKKHENNGNDSVVEQGDVVTAEAAKQQQQIHLIHHQKQLEKSVANRRNYSSLKVRIIANVVSKHQQFQSMLLSLQEDAIEKLDGDAIMSQIEQHYDAMTQLIQQCDSQEKKVKASNAYPNNRKHPRSEFEDSSLCSDIMAPKGCRSRPQRKRRKLGNRPVLSKVTDLTDFISPAPIHWKIQSVQDEAIQSNDNQQNGHFRIKLKTQKHPIKEALIQIGAGNFTVNDMLNTLTQSENDGDVIIERGKAARKRLKEELLVIPGVHRAYHSVNDEEIVFSAAKFYHKYWTSLHGSCDALHSALQSVKGIGSLRRAESYNNSGSRK